MCGIAGYVKKRREYFSNEEVQRAKLALAKIRHRGPDAHGEYCDKSIWLGHTRLSILDITDAGNQPMLTKDGHLIIAYNGEVYNFKDLKDKFSISDLVSGTDTEIVLSLFERFGISCLPKLNGIFAFAIYNKTTQKLWLIRDRLGVKPLYYSFNKKGLIFGSEIKVILSLMDESPVCDVSLLNEWLYYGNTLGGKTLYKDIEQLHPGCCLELDIDTFEYHIHEFWSLKQQAHISNILKSPTEEIISETRRLLEEAIKRQLVSDVPVGVFLSGGIDSSAITAIASKHYKGKLSTFSAGFDGMMSGVDERPNARKVASLFNTDHHELYIKGESIAELVENMVYHHDMPFSDSANIPLYLMASQISSKIKVVLQGDGGDELFGGYRRYVSLRYRPLFYQLAKLSSCFKGMVPDSIFGRRMMRYANAYCNQDIGITMAKLLTPIDEAQSSPLMAFNPEFRKAIEDGDPYVRYKQIQDLFSPHDICTQMSLIDLMVELPDIFLEKVDRSTMAASLEVRVPFLDNDLVDYIVRVPARNKVPWGRKKWLLKQVLKDVVPEFVLYGPKKGFNVPYGYWLRTSLKNMFFDHLYKFNRDHKSVLDVGYLEKSFVKMESGNYDIANLLWNILNFLVWVNNSDKKLLFG